MGKRCSYLVGHAISDHGTDTVDELVAHGIDDKHLVFPFGHLAVVVGAELTGEPDEPDHLDIQQRKPRKPGNTGAEL